MKKTSKLLSLALVVIMAFSVFAVNSSAVATELPAGSSKATATNIPKYDVEYVSTLSKAKEVDWFKFTTLSEDAYYTITLKNYNIPVGGAGVGNWYLEMFVYDEHNQEVIHNNSYYTPYTNIKLEKNTTYYVKVFMGSSKDESTGNYAMILSYKFDEIPNEKNKATSINLNKNIINSLDGTNDVDWFKFTTSSDDTSYTFNLQSLNIPEGGAGLGDWYLHLYIYDEYEQEIANVDTYYNTSPKATLEKNTTYYAKVVMGSSRNDCTGNYKFSINTDSQKTLSGINVSSLPAKLTYTVGEELDITGLAITANYSDGTSEAAASYTIDGFDSTTEGTKTITVSYTEGSVTKTCTFDVTVTATSDNSGTGFFLFDWFMAFINFIVNIFSILF